MRKKTIDLRSSDPDTWFATIWDALDTYRETNKVSDEAWDDICTAMAWIQEEFDVVSSRCEVCNDPADPNAYWNKQKDRVPLCETHWQELVERERDARLKLWDFLEVRKERDEQT